MPARLDGSSTVDRSAGLSSHAAAARQPRACPERRAAALLAPAASRDRWWLRPAGEDPGVRPVRTGGRRRGRPAAVPGAARGGHPVDALRGADPPGRLVRPAVADRGTARGRAAARPGLRRLGGAERARAAGQRGRHRGRASGCGRAGNRSAHGRRGVPPQFAPRDGDQGRDAGSSTSRSTATEPRSATPSSGSAVRGRAPAS